MYKKLAKYSLSLRIQDHHAAISLHNIGLNEEPSFTSTASSYDQDIQISSVFMSIEADPYVLSQDLVHVVRMLSVFPVHG